MILCAQCRAELIDGQVICRECGYDQRKSVGKREVSPGAKALTTLLWWLLLPATGVASLTGCAVTGVVLLNVHQWPGDLTFFCAIVTGIVGGVAVFIAGTYLIFWLQHR